MTNLSFLFIFLSNIKIYFSHLSYSVDILEIENESVTLDHVRTNKCQKR